MYVALTLFWGEYNKFTSFSMVPLGKNGLIIINGLTRLLVQKKKNGLKQFYAVKGKGYEKEQINTRDLRTKGGRTVGPVQAC